MKKVIKLTLAVALLLGSTSVFAQKLGRISTNEIILTMPELKEVQTNMQAYVKNLEEEMEALQVERNNKLQEYQKNYETYTDAVRDMKAKDLESVQNRIREFEQVAQQDIQKKDNELMAPLYEKAKNAIDKVASTNGFTAIFETGSLVYFDAANLTDITPLVKKELGIPENAQPVTTGAAN